MNQSSENKINQNYFQPGVANRYKILDILFRNPDSCSFDLILNLIDITKDNIRSTIGRLRKNKNLPYKFIFENEHITTRIKGKKPTKEDIDQNIIDGNNNIDPRTKPRGSRKNRYNKSTSDQLITILKNYPEGINTKDLLKKVNTSKTGLYSSIYLIRKKGYKVIYKNELYILKKEPKESINNYQYKNNEIQKTISPKINNDLIPSEFQSAFNNLPENDKLECINLLKKSMYFRKSAIALLESNQLAFNFCQNLIEGKEI